jgi:spore maturation protein CgeD
MSSKVSCLLTCYNRPAPLARAIDSVLDQSMDDLELLILDDNSGDTAVQSIYQWYWNHPKVRIYKDNVQEENRRATTRYATLINIGLRLARGEYISYLCDDDYYLPHRFELMCTYLDAHPEVGVVYGAQRCEAADPARTGFAAHHTRLRTTKGILSNAFQVVDHASVMHRRSLIEQVGYWDDDYAHYKWADGVFWNKLTSNGYLFYPVNDITDVHVFHDDHYTS